MAKIYSLTTTPTTVYSGPPDATVITVQNTGSDDINVVINGIDRGSIAPGLPMPFSAKISGNIKTMTLAANASTTTANVAINTV